jgi:WD40 repeat protein
LLYRLDGFANGVSGLVFSPDGAALLTARWYDWADSGVSAYLERWDASTGRPLPLEGDLSAAPDGLQHLVYSPDGRLLAGDENQNIHVWDAESGQQLQSLDNTVFMYALALSSDGRWLAAGSPDKAVRAWDVPSGELRATLSGHSDWVVGVAFAPTEPSVLATATARDGVQLWDVESGERLAASRPVGHTDGVEAVAYSPDGKLLATGSSDETVWLWDASSGQAEAVLDAFGMARDGAYCACVWSLAFSPDGTTLVTGSTDARVRQWDVATGELLYTSQAMGDLISGLGFSPDGQLVAAGDSDSNVWVWDLGIPIDAPPLQTFDNRGVVVSLAFDPAPPSPGGRLLATGSGFGAIRIWDADAGALVREMEGSHNSAHVVYSPDGRLLAVGEGGWAEEFPVRLWDPGSGELLRTLHGHTEDVSGLAFTPDGGVLASGDWDGTTRLWDVATGEQLQTLQQPWSAKVVAFRPDGRRLATAGFDGLVWIWGVP